MGHILWGGGILVNVVAMRTTFVDELSKANRKLRTLFDARVRTYGLTLSRARLLMHLAHADGATQTLETARGALGKDWPAPIYDYLTGKLSESKLAISAKSSDRMAFAERLCTAKFFAGEWTFLSGDTDQARALLQDATGTQAFYRLEFAAAKGRLAHMTK